MSRLIRYDDAIERLGAHLMANAQIDWGGTASTDIEDWKELADMILNGVPTVDAVSVVRCEKCMFSKVYQNDSSGVMGRFCEAFTQVRMVSDDDFCSYGERKETDHE